MRLLWLVGASPLIACAASSSQAGPSETDAAVPVDARALEGDASAADASGCTRGAVQSCNCGAGTTGSQRCSDRRWSTCDCEALTTPPCTSGYYVGRLSGEYRSDAVDADRATLTVEVGEPTGKGATGFWFTLEEDPNAQFYEFHTHTVTASCLLGALHDDLGSHPFVATIRGDLSCDYPNAFTGAIEGTYYVDGDMNDAHAFEGPLQATLGQDAFEDGRWDVAEDFDIAEPPGGRGTWQARRAGEVDAAPTLAPECEARMLHP